MLSPIDAHDVAEYIVLEAYDVGQRIGALELDGDVDHFLEACADLEPYVKAARWLTGTLAGELSDTAVEVVRETRHRWQAVHAEDTVAGDIASGERLDAQFERVLATIGGDA